MHLLILNINSKRLLFLPIKHEDEKETIRIYQRVNGKIKFTNTELDVNYTKLE